MLADRSSAFYRSLGADFDAVFAEFGPGFEGLRHWNDGAARIRVR